MVYGMEISKLAFFQAGGIVKLEPPIHVRGIITNV